MTIEEVRALWNEAIAIREEARIVWEESLIAWQEATLAWENSIAKLQKLDTSLNTVDQAWGLATEKIIQAKQEAQDEITANDPA